MTFHIKIPTHLLPNHNFEHGKKVELGKESLTEKKETETVINVATELGIKPAEIFKYTKVSLAQKITEDAKIAEKSGMFSSHAIRSPVTGEIRAINHQEGTVTIISSQSFNVPFSFSGVFEKKEGGDFIFKVEDGREYEVNVALPKTFGGETVYIENPQQIDLSSCENKIAISLVSSTMDSAKIAALSVRALISLTADYYTGDIPCLQLKDKKDWSELSKQKFANALYVENSKSIVFYN